MTTTNKIQVPCLLSFDSRDGFRPGRGDAGWCMYSFNSAKEALDFMDHNKSSAMPCWKDLRNILVEAGND